jgi:ribosomal protein S21
MASNGTKRRVSVTLRDGKDSGSLERALRELKRKLKKDGFYKEIRRREYFISPSEERKLKKRRRKSTDGEDLG